MSYIRFAHLCTAPHLQNGSHVNDFVEVLTAVAEIQFAHFLQILRDLNKVGQVAKLACLSISKKCCRINADVILAQFGTDTGANEPTF